MVADPVDHQRFGDQRRRPVIRGIQRGHRVLEDRSAPCAAGALRPRRRQALRRRTGRRSRSGQYAVTRPTRALGDGGFAAAGFADKGEGLALADVEADAVRRRGPDGCVTWPKRPPLQIVAVARRSLRRPMGGGVAMSDRCGAWQRALFSKDFPNPVQTGSTLWPRPCGARRQAGRGCNRPVVPGEEIWQ